MEIAIRYFTKSKKGNTEKLANVVSKALNIEALDVSKDLEEKADKLSIRLSDKEFHCAASWIFINKGLPTEADYKQAEKFILSI